MKKRLPDKIKKDFLKKAVLEVKVLKGLSTSGKWGSEGRRRIVHALFIIGATLERRRMQGDFGENWSPF